MAGLGTRDLDLGLNRLWAVAAARLFAERRPCTTVQKYSTPAERTVMSRAALASQPHLLTTSAAVAARDDRLFML